MRLVVRSVLGIVAALLMVGSAASADREIERLPDTDLPGFDYAVVKDTTIKACTAACLDDRACQAFTFNEKAGWCFLKSGLAEQAPFSGATSGLVVQSPSLEQIATDRTRDLPFPAASLVESAIGYADGLPQTTPPPAGISYADFVVSGDEAMAQSNAASALPSYRYALAIAAGDPALWLKLAGAANQQVDEERQRGGSTYELASIATYAALNAYLRSDSTSDRALGLAALAQGLEGRQMWRESIATYRASLDLVDDARLASRLDQVIAEHGFRITSHEVESEGAEPRICAVFSDPLPTDDTDLSRYVVVADAPTAAIETQQYQICVTGISHGTRYAIRLRAGLPSADGEELRSDVNLDIFVPDRSPFVGFANNAYVMPAGLGGGLPISSVNAETADVAIYRIGDRSMAAALRNGIFQRTLDGYAAEDVADSYGEKLWEGQLDLAAGAANDMTVTAVPVSQVLGDVAPGAYVITAKVAGTDQDYWRELATQWFIVTDLGLTAIAGDDGVNVFVRSLADAAPSGDVHVRLIARNNEVLADGTTKADGRITFAPGLARGEGGRAPQLIVAETEAGDYAFLDASKPAFDLTDRGVEGRPAPGPLDLFATTERGVYRPGETVFVTALLRDNDARAVADLPLTMELERPDGVVAQREVLNEQGAGGYFTALPMAPEAMRGAWQLRFYADPKAAAIGNVTFLVEDFEPERLAFEISAIADPVVIDETTEVDVAAKYLYGAIAPGLNVEADVVLRATDRLTGFPEYVFGRVDDPFETYYEPLGTVAVTDDNGNAVAEIDIPYPGTTTRPLDAQLLLRLVDSNGRPVQRSLTRPVRAETDRIGIKPGFDTGDGIDEGTAATFEVIAVDPAGATIDKAGLRWTLVRVETNYQWYRANDTWRWEAVSTDREVASGTLDASASGPVTITAPVEWGRYRIEVDGEETSTSYGFYAGYHYAEAGSNTPDTLDVVLDKERYASGETAVLRLEPQFAGTALVMVVDDRIIDMQAVDVPAEGTSVELPVTDDWGPGAYVTAVLYRPSDAAEKRMPARALGLAYAEVDPGDRRLDVSLDAPSQALPRQPFTLRVALGNATPGDTAYVAVAAVDLGILNLTNFKTPDPDGWYFGQRQLGVAIRDLYGNLIDPTQGEMGALRVGGDEGGARLGTPPATSVLVALHSGIVTVGDDGVAEVSFDMPDFAGTVRLMAMAYSAAAVGHASADVIVRDPVVVTLSPPRFLRIGDTSRLLVEIDNVDGAAGDYEVELLTGDGLVTTAGETIVSLDEGERVALDLPLSGTALGDNDLRVIITGPDGTALVKKLVLGVRAPSAALTRTRTVPLAPGESISLDDGEFAGMLAHTGSLTLAVGPIARLDVPGLLLALDRYPYGCAEQVTSRAFPLLYLNEVAETIGMGEDMAIGARIDDAIADLLSKQSSSGGFGLWGPFSGGDLWLDAYLTDFLLRAKAEGFVVPEQALERALDNLGNQVSYAADFTSGGEDLAYALYDLARAGRASIGDLRYYVEARLDNFASPLAKAQLGAALSLYGDRARAATAFAAAIEDLGAGEDRVRWRGDYGSRLRDTAAVLALAAEFTPSGIDIAALTAELAARRDAQTWTSTQEDAWTLIAAAGLAREATSGDVTIAGETVSGSAYRRVSQEALEAESLTITNEGNRPTEVTVTVTAIPEVPPAPSGNGFDIDVAWYLPDGTVFDPSLSQVRQNDRFVVVMTVGTDALGSGHYIVADPLPGGFEIENENLSSGSGVGDLSWLSRSYPTHVEGRTDQYVAAFRYTSKPESTFSAAYLVRAVSPGTFVVPAAVVEDMYRPERQAISGSGSVEILPAGQ